MEVSMLNAKLLASSGVFAAGTWEVWSDPRWFNVMKDVAGAMVISWLIFLCVFYITTLRIRRESQRALGSVPHERRHALRERTTTH